MFGQEYVGGTSVPPNNKYVGYFDRKHGTAHQRAIDPGSVTVEVLASGGTGGGNDNGGNRLDPASTKNYTAHPITGLPYRKFTYEK